MRAEGTAISSTASDDVDMLDGQDQETVAVSGTHLGGVVAQKRTKVKNSNASEKVTVDVLSRHRSLAVARSCPMYAVHGI